MKNHKHKLTPQHLKQMQVIYTCIENGDLKRFKMIQNIEKYIDLEYTDYGWNMIHLASWFKSDNILKYILQLPEAVNLINAPDKNQETPLHLAFFTEGRECIQTLIEYGANPLSENIIRQVPVQTMTAPRENQYQTLLEIQKTLTNESQFNSISPYLQKLKQELDMERGSTTAPCDLQSKIKIDPISPIKIGNQILDDDYQFIHTNLNSQQPYGGKDINLLSFQSASNQYNDEVVGLSNFGSQQNLNQQGQYSKLESLLNQVKKGNRDEVDLQEERAETETIENYAQNTKKNQNQPKKLTQKNHMEDSDIQDEQKHINLNYFQTRIRQFTSHSTSNA